MSKKADHFETGGNKDAEETSLEEASEEMVRKRILTSSPTPHRGNSPQGRFRPAILSPDDLHRCRKVTINYSDIEKILSFVQIRAPSVFCCIQIQNLH